MTIVQKMREKAKLSQIELSRRSGVKQSVISDIENGHTKSPRVETMMALGNVLGFDWRDFYAHSESCRDEKAV